MVAEASPMPDSVPVPGRTPEEERERERESGYTSSNDDDHFSDAPEGPPATTTAAVEKSTSTLIPTPKVDEQMDSDIAIPGAFGSDGTDDELDGAAVTAVGTPKPVASRPTTPMRSDDIEVKWNEKTDVISPKVRGERKRIEKLVQEQRERSRSPSSSPASVRVRKTSSLFSAQGESEQQLEPVVPDEDDRKDDEPMEAAPDVGAEVATAEVTTPTCPERRSPSPVDVEESKELPTAIAVTEEDGDDATPVAEKLEPVVVTEDTIEQKAEVAEERPEDEEKEDVTEEGEGDVPEEKREVVDVTEEEKGDVLEEKGDVLEEKEDDGFGGDDFDDFGEAVEADGGDFNDFDDFEGFQDGDADGTFDEPESVPEAAPTPPPPPPPQPIVPQLPVPLPDFGDEEGVRFALADAVEKMFPKEGTEQRKPTSVEGRSFLTDRSQSLWNQLVAPPPLQPPNWKISRIRRLFLVSLGIPMDLDEVLPPETKQKKLVLPSVHLSRHPESRPSSRNSRRSGSLSRKKKGAEDKNQINPESLDIPSARILCSTSTIALQNFTVAELLDHIQKLEETTATASEVLTYWLGKRDSAMSDKETFETVIESLVGYARKKRQNG
ncbi:hypothetical protein BZA05DRAFT_410548 [Tricharina praecox]|uniref:uncharacterized protein n=1 Tax=Tricharina praecox TaxID=43433 RepID=UPI00221FC21B|nr:uncharacterized protein BZA05DRAFT_410548 [Tricharina praecox]KAI5843752.1 hypothetical protein BZA05DRAFT_410548 [Tricharina praecox]